MPAGGRHRRNERPEWAGRRDEWSWRRRVAEDTVTVEEETYHLTDDKVDILSHPRRRNQIHVLTVDPILGTDLCERIHDDERLKHAVVVRPVATSVPEALEQVEEMAMDTVSSRLIIFDVRRVTLPKLRRPFNAVVGYNRRDFNKLCYSICVGDGPVTLFQVANTFDVFVPYLSSHRMDYYPSVFFYDPFLQYEPNELETRGIDDRFIIPDQVPQRLVRYLQKRDDLRLEKIRRFFRAVGKDEEIKKRRLRMLRRLYKRQLRAQFPDHADEVKDLVSRHGVGLATERLNLYPLFFEDWVYKLMRRAEENAHAKPDGTPQ
jgi:hypothetical protein